MSPFLVAFQLFHYIRSAFNGDKVKRACLRLLLL